MFGIGGFDPLKMMSSFIPQLQAIQLGLQLFQMGQKLMTQAIDLFSRAAQGNNQTKPSDRGDLPTPGNVDAGNLQDLIVKALSEAIEKSLSKILQNLEGAGTQQGGAKGTGDQPFDLEEFISRINQQQTDGDDGGEGGTGKPGKGGKGGKGGSTSSNPWVRAYAKIMEYIDQQMQKLDSIDFESMSPSEAGTQLFEVQVAVQQAQKGADAISNAFKSWTDTAGTATRNIA